MTEIPDRVSLFQDSPHFFKDWARLGVKINGQPSSNVAEFCVSERWVRVLVKDGRGHYRRERGKLITVKIPNALVEPYWRIQPEEVNA